MKKLAWIALALATAASAQEASCPACHGASGEGKPAMNAPRIAGLGEGYIARQLDAYANGGRDNPVMSPIAKQLAPEQRRAFAQMYANTESTAKGQGGAASAAGRKLATVGDAARQVQACANCHGPDGVGQPPFIPALAGQHANYLVASLQGWKSQARKTDPSGQMSRIAAQLQPADIQAVAKYYASLPPPSPKTLTTRGPATAPPASTVSSPGQTQPVQGVGIEQGTPTTGGGQGPGGGGTSTQGKTP
jgi:cytochrome c553